MSVSRFSAYAADHIEHAMLCAERLPESIHLASERILTSLLDGGRVLCAGTGQADLLAQYFSRLLLDRLELQRPPLPALWLNSGNADNPYKARQLSALTGPKDVLLLVHLEPQPCPLLDSADSQTAVIYLHPEGHAVGNRPHQLAIALPGERRARLHEGALLVLHAVCDHIDMQLFGA